MKILAITLLHLFSDLKLESALLQLDFKHSLKSKQKGYLLQGICDQQEMSDLQEIF